MNKTDFLRLLGYSSDLEKLTSVEIKKLYNVLNDAVDMIGELWTEVNDIKDAQLFDNAMRGGRLGELELECDIDVLSTLATMGLSQKEIFKYVSKENEKKGK